MNLVLNEYATISAVLYANTNHPELKVDYPNWNERCKQILKKWRALSPDKRTPYLQKAKENRSYLKKAQQVSKFTHVKLAIKIHWTKARMHEMNDEKIQRSRMLQQTLFMHLSSKFFLRIFFFQKKYKINGKHMFSYFKL